MTATTLPQLRSELHEAERVYRDALSHYFAAHVNTRDLGVVQFHAQACRHQGAALDAALGALIDALGNHLTNDACALEQRRLQARRGLLAAELRLLGH